MARIVAMVRAGGDAKERKDWLDELKEFKGTKDRWWITGLDVAITAKKD